MRRMARLDIPNFPEQLLKEIKLQAVSEDRTIKKWVERAIKEKLSKSDKSRRWEET
jgi:hypothetical protein